jgi:hypothetical protein
MQKWCVGVEGRHVQGGCQLVLCEVVWGKLACKGTMPPFGPMAGVGRWWAQRAVCGDQRRWLAVCGGERRWLVVCGGVQGRLVLCEAMAGAFSAVGGI